MKLAALLFFVSFLPACSGETRTASNALGRDPIPAATPDRSVEAVVPDTPKTTWEPIYFQSIDKATASTGFERLRESKVADTDIEVRVWAGFGKTLLKGFLLKRDGSAWTAYRIGPDEGRYPFQLKKLVITEPRIGWESAWHSLLQQNILSLPDARSINCEARYADGYSYVVEIKKGPNYRTYMYGNPWAKFENRCNEADEILNIAGTITNDYGISGFRWDD
jgi:hypothetical protein